MKKTLIPLLLFLVFLKIALAESPIGCEKINNTLLKCHNQGSIEAVTYYQYTADGLQFANNETARLGWATYEHGFIYNRSDGTPVIINFFDLPNITGRWESDNATYYLLNFSGTNSIGGKVAYIEYTAGQLLYDDLVNFTLRLRTISGFTAWNKTVSLYRGMKRINIDNDGDVDVINLYGINETGGNESYNYYLNETRKFSLLDKNFSLGDLDGAPTSSIEWRWYNNRSRELRTRPNGANPNYRVYWWMPVRKALKDNKTYELSEYWIDAPKCNKACPPNVWYSYHRDRCAGTHSEANCSADANRMIDLYYFIRFAALFGSGTCTYSNGCYITQRDNTNIFYFETKWKTETGALYDQLHCINRTAATCRQNTITYCTLPFCSYSESQRFRVQCIKAVNITYTNGYFIKEATGATNALKMLCPGDKPISVNISAYPNGQSFNVTDNIPFQCNVSDYYPLQNKTLWGDWSGWGIKETQILRYRLFNDTNFSTVTGLDPGVYAWNCLGCDNNGDCSYAASNNTFTVLDEIAPYVLLNAPANNSNYWDNQSITFNCTGVDEYKIKNVSLWHNLTGVWHLNATGEAVIATTNFTLTNITQNNSIGVYAWNCEACDTFGNCAFNLTNYTVKVNDSTIIVEVEEEEFTDDFIAILALLALIWGGIWLFTKKRRAN